MTNAAKMEIADLGVENICAGTSFLTFKSGTEYTLISPGGPSLRRPVPIDAAAQKSGYEVRPLMWYYALRGKRYSLGVGSVHEKFFCAGRGVSRS